MSRSAVALKQDPAPRIVPKPSLKAKIQAKVEATIEARQQLSDRIKVLSREMADLNAELLTMVEASDDLVETDRWKAQVIRPDKTSFDKQVLKEELAKRGVSAIVIQKCYEKATTVLPKGGTPYVRVDGRGEEKGKRS